ncbi:MAG TPA: hypothetical protein VFF06_04290 [Polyangia bacterium]|nr:hypothetical protein [Polyangia bacterium]
MRLPLLMLLVAGCGDRPDAWTAALDVSGPYPLVDSVAWVDGARGEIFWLDPATSPPSVLTLAAGRTASFALPTPDRKRLLVLTSGREATKRGQTTIAPALLVVERMGAAPAVTATYPLTSPFDRLAVAPDGTRAIAFYSASPPSDPAFFRNPNELAIVDLTSAPDANTNPAHRTIRSLGSSPLGVVYAPPLQIPPGMGDERALAVVLSTNYVTFLDLAHGDRSEITVPLVPIGSSATVTPEQVVFSPETATVFVRAQGAADVFALALAAQTPTDPAENDFVPRINQPSTGKTALDMILYNDGASTILLTANASNDVALIDATTAEFSTLPMGAPVDSILAVPPGQPTTAVLFSRSSPQSFVQFVALKDLSANLARNVTRRTLAQPVHDLVATPDGNQLIVVHDDARTVISILDLGPRRTDTPIDGQVVLQSYAFAGSRFLAGVSSSLSRLGILDLTTLATRDLRLDYAPARVLSVGTRLIVDHGAPEGLVTVVPDATSPREDTRVLSGIFLQRALDAELGN